MLFITCALCVYQFNTENCFLLPCPKIALTKQRIFFVDDGKPNLANTAMLMANYFINRLHEESWLSPDFRIPFHQALQYKKSEF